MKTFQQPLTAGEEAYYIRLLREGTVEEAIQAKEILVERNLRLVAHIAKKYQNVEEDMEDLISIGCIGLIKAVNSFDSGKGRLATYACRCIDNELLMMLRSRKKLSREVSLYEPIGQDKEGNAIHLLDVIEEKQKDIVEDMELGRNIRRLFSALDHCLFFCLPCLINLIQHRRIPAHLLQLFDLPGGDLLRLSVFHRRQDQLLFAFFR